MPIQAHLETPQQGNRRFDRRRLHLGVSGRTSTRELSAAVIQNLSETGLLIQTRAVLKVGENIRVDLPQAGEVSATVVWKSDDFIGCQFDQPIRKSAVSAALLRSTPEQPVAPMVTPATQFSWDEAELADAADTSKMPFGLRIRMLIGVTLALWALIILAASRFV